MSYPTGVTRRSSARAQISRGSPQTEYLLSPQWKRPRNFSPDRSPAVPRLPPLRERREPSPGFRRVPQRRPGGGGPSLPPVVPASLTPPPTRRKFRVPRIPLRHPALQLIDLVDFLPGRWPQEQGEYKAPEGWVMDAKCHGPPPSNYNGSHARRTSNPAAAELMCLQGQAYSHVGYGRHYSPGEPLMITGTFSAWMFGRYQSGVLFTSTARFQNFMNFSKIGTGPWPTVEIPFVIQPAEPIALPVPTPHPAMVPSPPDDLPSRGNTLPERPREQEWPEPLDDRLPTRDPYMPHPMPWYPGGRVPRPGVAPGVIAPPGHPGSKPGEVVTDTGGVEVSPSGETVTLPVGEPWFRPRQRPPGRTRERVRERKQIANPAAGSLLGRALNFYTESLDFLNALHQALPIKYRTPPREVRKGVFVPPRPHRKAMDLYEHYDKIDVDKAIKNILFMQAQDALIGKLNRGINRNLAPWYDRLGRPVGITVGPAI